MDPYSPFAPAYVRVLVLPVGHIDKTTFLDVLSRLQEEASIISLTDILPFLDDNDTFLHAPNASSKGSLLYDYTTSAPTEQDQHLSPFELYRDPLLVIGIVDGLDFSNEDPTKQLQDASTHISKVHPRIVDKELIVLGVPGDSHTEAAARENVVYIDREPQIDSNSLQYGIRKISARFLRELSTYTQAMQVSPSIQTPGQTARSLQRSASQRDSERRPGSSTSGQSTPTPSQSNDAMSPVSDSGSRPPPWSRSSPATSFDQIHNTSAGLARSDSRASARGKAAPRASSQDRVAVQGFGSSSSQDKLKRGKARVGLVVGSIYMMAGQWSEALKMLTEHTNKARLLGDHIWHGKGLENIVVCLLLHSWGGMEFQIPSICYLLGDKSNQRFSVSLGSDSKLTDIASVRSLQNTLPELVKHIVSLYKRGEEPLDLPLIPIAEAMVRYGKMLAALHISNGLLDRRLLDRLIGKQGPQDFARVTILQKSVPGPATGASKAAISEMLSSILESGLDDVPDAAQIGILCGAATVYGIVGMDRKKGMVMKTMVTKLGDCLEQAVKQGASASTEDASIYGFKFDSLHMDGLMLEMARIYHIPLAPTDSNTQAAAATTIPLGFSGNVALKTGILRELMHLFGADSEKPLVLNSYLRLAASFLRVWSPHTVEDIQHATTPRGWRPEVADAVKEVGSLLEKACQQYPSANVPYWDPLLVRGLSFQPLRDWLRVHQQSADTATLAAGAPANPLLYDPSASRPGTAVKAKQIEMAVGETSRCLLTLQNPFNTTMQVESIRFDTDAIDIETTLPYELKPLKLQNVILRCTPLRAGELSVDGLWIKMKGVREQKFAIMEHPKTPHRPVTLKAIPVVRTEAVEESLPGDALGGDIVSIIVADAQPLLSEVKEEITESAAMLLAGEQRNFTIWLKNVSEIPAVVMQIQGLEHALRYRPEGEDGNTGYDDTIKPGAGREKVSIPPGEVKSFSFTASCGSGSYRGDLIFLYGRAEENNQEARVLTVPLNMTVVEVLRLRHLDVLPSRHHESLGGKHMDMETCNLVIEVANSQSSSVSFFCSFDGVSQAQHGSIAGHASTRLLLNIPRLRDDDAVLDLEKATAILQSRLHISWQYNGREGAVSTAALSLSPSALPSLLTTPIDLSLIVLDAASNGHSARWTCKSGNFAVIRAKIMNRSGPTGPLFAQMLLADERRMAITGTKGRVVAPLGQGESREMDFGVCPLLVGEVEVTISVKTVLGDGGLGGSGEGVQGSLRMMVV